MTSLPTVSIVIPVKNGAGRLEHCLASLQRQDYPRELIEVIVADGRSTDTTAEIARRNGCTVIDNPRQTVAGGRNVGVAAARCDYVAFSEDDMILPVDWVSSGVQLLADSAIDAVGGPTPIPNESRPFSKAVDVIFRLATLGGYSVQSGIGNEARDATDLPGGNAMYRRRVFDATAPMDEGMVTGEDVDFHIRLRKRGYKLCFSPRIVAWHHKRDTPRRFFTQIRRFAQGRVQLGRRHREAVRGLHWLVALAMPAAVLSAVLIDANCIAALAVVLLTTSVVVGFAMTRSLRAALWVPVASAIFTVAWSYGFIGELIAPTRDATGR